MHLLSWGIHVLEALFLVGIAGSAIVVVISFIEDAHELRGDDDSPATASQNGLTH